MNTRKYAEFAERARSAERRGAWQEAAKLWYLAVYWQNRRD